MIVVIAIAMLLAGLAVGGVGLLLMREGRELTGVAAWSRQLFGVALLIVGLVVVVGMVGTALDPF